jgi:hypothetical protein
MISLLSRLPTVGSGLKIDNDRKRPALTPTLRGGDRSGVTTRITRTDGIFKNWNDEHCCSVSNWEDSLPRRIDCDASKRSRRCHVIVWPRQIESEERLEPFEIFPVKPVQMADDAKPLYDND